MSSQKSRKISGRVNTHGFKSVSMRELERMARDWFAWLDTESWREPNLRTVSSYSEHV
jgi:hypothetical protein